MTLHYLRDGRFNPREFARSAYRRSRYARAQRHECDDADPRPQFRASYACWTRHVAFLLSQHNTRKTLAASPICDGLRWFCTYWPAISRVKSAASADLHEGARESCLERSYTSPQPT